MRYTPDPSILSPHFLRLCDLRDPDFARSKLSYRDRKSRRLCKILTLPLQVLLRWDRPEVGGQKGKNMGRKEKSERNN